MESQNDMNTTQSVMETRCIHGLVRADFWYIDLIHTLVLMLSLPSVDSTCSYVVSKLQFLSRI